MKAEIENHKIIVGNDNFLHLLDIEHEDCELENTVAYVVNEKSTRYIADKFGIDKYYARLLPHDKVGIIEEIIKKSSGKTVFADVGVTLLAIFNSLRVLK